MSTDRARGVYSHTTVHYICSSQALITCVRLSSVFEECSTGPICHLQENSVFYENISFHLFRCFFHHFFVRYFSTSFAIDFFALTCKFLLPNLLLLLLLYYYYYYYYYFSSSSSPSFLLPPLPPSLFPSPSSSSTLLTCHYILAHNKTNWGLCLSLTVCLSVSVCQTHTKLFFLYLQ